MLLTLAVVAVLYGMRLARKGVSTLPQLPQLLGL